MDNNELPSSAAETRTPEEKRRDFVKRFLITLGVGLVCSVLLMLLLGAFSKETRYETYSALCDSFFVAGILTVGVGLLTLSANSGTFTLLGYSVSLWGKLLRKDLSAESRSYYDYRKRKLAIKRPYLHYVLSGCVLILIAAVFYVLYNSAYAAA